MGKQFGKAVWVFLSVLAVVVQTAPAGASTLGGSMPCGPARTPVSTPHGCCPTSELTPCGKPCCSPKAAPESSRQIAERRSAEPCGCELAPRDAAAATPAAAPASPGVDAVALPSAPVLPRASRIESREPGVLGSDSSPPIGGERSPDQGRAPPVL